MRTRGQPSCAAARQCRSARCLSRFGEEALLALLAAGLGLLPGGCSRWLLSRQLSVSELSVPPRGTGQFSGLRGRSSWQDAGITHLEADLSSPDREPCAGDQLRVLPFTPLQVPIAAVGLQAGR